MTDSADCGDSLEVLRIAIEAGRFGDRRYIAG